MHPMRKKFLVLFLLALVLAPSWRPVCAADGLKISPLRIEELVNPGEALKRSIRVTNESDAFKIFFPLVMDFQAEDETGKAKLIEPGSVEGSFMSAWVDISKEGIDFGPGEEKEIPFTINVPKEIGPGGYYGAILFGTEPPKIDLETNEEKGAAISVAQQTGALVLLQVAGQVDERAEVRDFTTDKEVYATPFKVNFNTRIENFGNVHIRPVGVIEINNMFGKKIAVLHVNERGNNILPKTKRKFENLWTSDLGFGRYEAVLSLSYGTEPQFGGEGKQTLYQKKYFWIFPWKIIMASLSGLILLLGLVFGFLKFYKNRAIEKVMVEMGIKRPVMAAKRMPAPSAGAHFGLIALIVITIIFLLSGAAYLLFFA